MRALTITFACLLVACGGESGGAAASGSASAKGSAKTTATTSAKPAASTPTTAAPPTTASAAPSASASAAEGPAKNFACDAIANNNACLEFGKTAASEEEAKKACDADPWKGKLVTEGCPKDGRVGMCTVEAGTPKETNTFVYAKGKKTLDSKAGKKDHCAKGDWTDLK